jgi:hypothetical protein
METARERWREEQQRQAAFQRPPGRRQRPAATAASKLAARPPAPREPAPVRPDLAPQLATFQAALPGSRGAAYLQQRGVGYAAPGRWSHAARDWRGGRVVFPHMTPDGGVVNLYGRAARWMVPGELSLVWWICETPACESAGRQRDWNRARLALTAWWSLPLGRYCFSQYEGASVCLSEEPARRVKFRT